MYEVDTSDEDADILNYDDLNSADVFIVYLQPLYGLVLLESQQPGPERHPGGGNQNRIPLLSAVRSGFTLFIREF